MQLLLLVSLLAPASAAPHYASATIVNSATGQSTLAPNTFATIYGTGLAYITRAMTPADIQGSFLPVYLSGTGVTVNINGIAAPIWYVSPTQINFLVPSTLLPGPATVVVSLDNTAGPEASVRLIPAAPGLFLKDPETVAAVHLDGSLVNAENPARKGEDIVLFATGLGPVQPQPRYLEVSRTAAPLVNMKAFVVLLNGEAVPANRIRYAGAAPGFAGLYQINLWLPENIPANPEIRLAIDAAISPAGPKLPVR